MCCSSYRMRCTPSSERSQRIKKATSTSFALGLLLLSGSVSSASQEGRELIGTPAPELAVTEWIESEPLTLGQLLGSVVLVRFWTDGCPYCQDSAPVLTQLHERYAPQGLVVLGIYHPKPARSIDLETVRQAAKIFPARFPIGLDPEWKTLKRRWLRDQERVWTSASLLIDRQGIIRFVHEGGSYSEEDARELEEAVTLLLALKS